MSPPAARVYWRATPAGIAVPLRMTGAHRAFDQLRLELTFAEEAKPRLVRLALWPAQSRTDVRTAR